MCLWKKRILFATANATETNRAQTCSGENSI